MKHKERRRDTFQALPGPDYWDQKATDGWKLVAAEWEKDAPETSDSAWVEEVPYGMKVGSDCLHLVENPEEKDALLHMLEMIIADKPFSEIADSLNVRGFRTRACARWTQIDIFELMPRLVAVASRVYPTHDWSERRKSIHRLSRQ
jgi:hypothetical protein